MATKKTKAAKVDAPITTITAYKGFDKNMQCRGFQFEIGKTYDHSGRVVVCKSGFHSCANPLDVWSYYNLIDSKFCEVEISGELYRHDGDSKIASARIRINAEIGLSRIIGDAVKFIAALCKPDAASETASGDYSQLAASGDYSKLAASGDSSQLAAGGNYSQLAASGKSSIAMTAAVDCKVMAGDLGAIVLTRWVESEKRYRVSAAYVGENGIKANVFYTLSKDGEFVEVTS